MPQLCMIIQHVKCLEAFKNGNIFGFDSFIIMLSLMRLYTAQQIFTLSSLSIKFQE